MCRSSDRLTMSTVRFSHVAVQGSSWPAQPPSAQALRALRRARRRLNSSGRAASRSWTDAGVTRTSSSRPDEQVNHAALVSGAVGRLLDQPIGFGVSVQDGLALGPGGLVERSRPGEQVLHIEGRKPAVIAYLLKASKRTG